VQGHTRGNHVTMIKGALSPGIHRATVVHATPNRLYCEAADAASLEPVARKRELNVISLPMS